MDNAATSAKIHYAIIAPSAAQSGSLCYASGDTPAAAWAAARAEYPARALRLAALVEVPDAEWDYREQQPTWCVIP